MPDFLLPASVRAAIQADLDKPLTLERLMPEPIEGVVVERGRTVEEFCQGVVEMLTEWDWAEVPDDLRADLRSWARDFYAWMRTQR